MSQIEELNRRLDNIVPGGLRNREGVQFFRQFIQSLKGVIADALQAIQDAAAAQQTANQGVASAAGAQATANQAVADAAGAQATANQGVSDAAAAQSDATAAQTSAAAAQVTANQGITDAATAQATATQAATDLAAHELVQATPTQLGHMLQGGAPAGAISVAPGPAPAVYTQAYADAQTTRADDAHARLNSLIASLQAANIIQ